MKSNVIEIMGTVGSIKLPSALANASICEFFFISTAAKN